MWQQEKSVCLVVCLFNYFLSPLAHRNEMKVTPSMCHLLNPACINASWESRHMLYAEPSQAMPLVRFEANHRIWRRNCTNLHFHSLDMAK